MDTDTKLILVAVIAAVIGGIIAGGSVWMILGTITRQLLKDVATQTRVENKLTDAGLLETINRLSQTFENIVTQVGGYLPPEALQPLIDLAAFAKKVSDGLPNIVENPKDYGGPYPGQPPPDAEYPVG